MLCDWLKNLALLTQPIKNKTKTSSLWLACTCFPAHGGSYTVHEFSLSSDWFIGLSASAVIGQSSYFGYILVLQHTIENLCFPSHFSRLSTIVNADQILVVHDGEIIERGR